LIAASSIRADGAMHKCIAAMQHERFKSPPNTPIFAMYEKNERRERRNENTMNIIRNYRNWRRFRETVSELNRLSNRELHDLGISRSDIPYVARKSV
jgi:uncharacterized protein YjiS (DUF1127 family)